MHRRNFVIVLLALACGCGGQAGSEAPLQAGPGQELVKFNVPGMT